VFHKDLFSLERQYDFPDEVGSFCDAMVIVVNCASLEDLSDCVELMSDAAQALEVSLPRDGFAGSDLGNALVSWPKGRLLHTQFLTYLFQVPRPVYMYACILVGKRWNVCNISVSCCFILLLNMVVQ
jgi:hypothetical protein